MTWFNIIKNVISVKIYDKGGGTNIPPGDNKSWADWILMALHVTGRLDKIRDMDSGFHQRDSGEKETGMYFMGVPITAIYQGTMAARGFPEYLELRQQLPEQGTGELFNDIVVLWETLKNQNWNKMKSDENWANAVLGPFPSALEQYRQQLKDDIKRTSGLFGRYRKTKM